MLRCLSVSTKIHSSKPNKLPHGGHTTHKISDLWKQTSALGNTRNKITLQLQLFVNLFFFFGERQTPHRIKLHVKTKRNAKLITSTQAVTSSLSLQPRTHGTASFTETTTCQNKPDILKSFHFSCRSEKLTRKPSKACYQQFEGKNLGRNSSAFLILLSLLAQQAFISNSLSFINYSKGDQEFEVNVLILFSTVPTNCQI